jgi:hypothetical protein
MARDEWAKRTDGREGRFKIDDTAKKWAVRLCVAWTLFCIALAVLAAAGVHALFN